MLGSIFKSSIRPIIFSPVSSGSSTSRYFTDLASVSAQYYTIPSIALSGDFEVEGKFTTVGASTQVLIGSTTSHYVAQVSNNWNVSISGVTSNFGSSVAEQDGKLHTYKLTRVGSTIEFFIDEVSRGTTGTQTGTFTLSNIGSNPTFYWPGVLADVKIWKDGDRNTGTLVRDYPLNEDFSQTDIVVNSAVILGVEKVINGTFDVNVNDWITGIGGTKTFDNGTCQVTGGVITGIYQAITTIIGKTYLVEYESTQADGNHKLRLSTGSTSLTGDIYNGPDSAVPAKRQVVFTAISTSVTVYLRNSLAGLTINWDNISVKEAPGYGTAINSPVSEKFTPVSGGWEGVEDWANPPDVVDTGWVYDGGGQYTLTGDGSFQALGMNTPIDAGVTYKVSFNMVSLSANMKLQSTSTFMTITSTGQQELLITTDGAQLRFARVTGITNCVIKNISIKRILENA